MLGVHAFMSVIWTKLQADSLLTSFIRLSCALLMVWLRKAHSVHLMATISFQSMTRVHSWSELRDPRDGHGSLKL